MDAIPTYYEHIPAPLRPRAVSTFLISRRRTDHPGETEHTPTTPCHGPQRKGTRGKIKRW